MFLLRIIRILVSGVRPLVKQLKVSKMETDEKRIRSILEEYRTLAFDALDQLMFEAFHELGRALAETEGSVRTDASGPVPVRAVCGLSARTLRQIQEHYEDGDLADWLDAGIDGERLPYLREFLNLNSLEMKELKMRHSNAFTRWTAEQEASLLASYREYAESGVQVPWWILSLQSGRNVNALKLRLEKLGVDLGPEAGRPRRPGGRAR